jgi:hypothetical protein
LSVELIRLFNDLDQARLRVVRPSKFVFFCGGQISSDGRAESLRDYLFRVRKIQRYLSGNVVLAERAVQLYRDTSYTDLISFEEDIARLSSVVLVIAESAGSLAELGAFSTNETISPSLRVILQSSYSIAESFIRFGPVRRVEKRDRAFIGFYPWQINGRKRPIIATVKPHFLPIRDFILSHLKAIPKSSSYEAQGEGKIFYVLYWIIYLAFVIGVAEFDQLAAALLGPIAPGELRNRLYCMELAGWIARVPYSGKDYLCTCHDADPFQYAFNVAVGDKDSSRRTFQVAQSLKDDSIPRHVKDQASSLRRRK